MLLQLIFLVHLRTIKVLQGALNAHITTTLTEVC